jgi:hypothetical protein
MKLTTIKIRTSDLQRMKKLSLHSTEPRWSVIKRMIDIMEKKKESK